MCGISGIVHNFNEHDRKLNLDKINFLEDRLKSMSISCDSLSGLEEIMNEIEVFTDCLFAFENFYKIYISPGDKLE